MKIEKLTKEQEALLPVIAQKWINQIGQKYNRSDVEEGIEFLYSISDLQKPKILHVSSPLGLQYAANILKVENQVWDQVRDQVGLQVGKQAWEQVWDQVGEQVENQVWDQVRDQVGLQVGKQAWEQVGEQVEQQVREQVGEQVRNQVWDQVWEQVRKQIGDQVWDQVREQVGLQVGKQIWNQVWDQVGEQVGDQVGQQVREQVEPQIGDQVREQVRNQVWDQVRDQVGQQIGEQVWQQVRDQVWEQVRQQVLHQVRNQVGEQVEQQIENQVRNQVGEQVEQQVWEQVRDQAWDQVWVQVREQVGDQVWEQVEQQVRKQVRDQVWNQVREQVGKQVGEQVEKTKLTFYPFAYRGTVYDYDWLAWCEFYQTILEFKNESQIEMLKKLSSCFSMLQFKNLVIACEHPILINKDDRGRLHSETEAAIKWADGYAQYYINGVAVTEKIVKTPELITIEEIKNETNLEKQRIMINRFGTDRYLIESGAKLIDADLSNRKGARALMEDNQGLKWLVCTDGSTDRVYYLAAPEESKTCKEAHEALCGFREDRIVLEG